MLNCATILVVENDKDIREAMKLILEDEGFVVDTAANGLEGLEKLKSLTKPVLIFLDLLMPKMSGHDFLKEVENNPIYHPLQVVVVTAAQTHTRMPYTGPFIAKPFDIEVLLQEARKHCGQLKSA